MTVTLEILVALIEIHRPSKSSFTAAALVAVSSFAGGLFVTRVAFEWLFPSGRWLGRSVLVLLLVGAVTLMSLLLWRVLSHGDGFPKIGPGLAISAGKPGRPTPLTASLPFIPWLAGLLYLGSPSVDLILSRLLFWGSAWLSALFLAQMLAQPQGWRWLGPLFLLVALMPVYLLTMGQTVGTADTFEFQVVVPQLGIAHPTGYPLYLLSAKPFTWLPMGSVAWRVNLATAVFGLVALVLIYLLVWRILGRSLPAILAAIAFGLTPTFWSQAVEAEVYTLHALLVTSALLLIHGIGGWSLVAGKRDELSSRDSSTTQIRRFLSQPFGQSLLLALVLGLGMANHLTTVILIPGAILTLWLALRQDRYAGSPVKGMKAAALILCAFLIPLLLYSYLPWRWQAVNGESMGLSRFADWVIGGRFQGALQLSAWLKDGARYTVVGRLADSEWQPTWLLIFSLGGAVFLTLRRWRFGLILFITWLGYIFYGLNYYVPDLAVFLIPAYLIMAVWWGIGLGAFLAGIDKLASRAASSLGKFEEADRSAALLLQAAAVVILLAIIFLAAADRWVSIDASRDDGRMKWGEAVLSLPLEQGAAILADSDKFPPLYYLQQVEGLRPDLEILLLPDEGAYRSALDNRLASGQLVYLARFLPGLEGVYHLSSTGPLTRVSTQPLAELPSAVSPVSNSFGPLHLLGYSLDRDAPFGQGKVPITFFWSAPEPVGEPLQVYLRLVGAETVSMNAGRHPANNYYPTVAWEPGEIVPDFHLLEVPPGGDARFQVEAAVAPPFTPAGELQWQPVTSVDAAPAAPLESQPLRAQVGPVYLEGVVFPGQVRPLSEISLVLFGHGDLYQDLRFELRPIGTPANSTQGRVPASASPGQEFLYSPRIASGEETGRFDLVVSFPGQVSVCGWLQRAGSGCILGQVEVSGHPLPENAYNFQDLIALTHVDIPDLELSTGGVVELELGWLPLAEISEDYTVFVQLLDAQDRIVGQVDSWPLQGTFPTSQWKVGEAIFDPYRIQLDPDLEPGGYRLHVGLYLLETLQRLSLVDASGQAIDDRVEMPGFFVR